jgi:hypothetical protein
MAVNDYHFITHWRVQSSLEEINDVIGDGPNLARWWPSVYLSVNELEPGDADGVGKVIDLYTKGWLPYTLRWSFRVTETHYPHGFTLEAWGDFVGRGTWTFESDGDRVNITYDWKIRAGKPLLRNLFLAPQACLFCQSPLGNAHGRRKPQTRTRPPSCPHTRSAPLSRPLRLPPGSSTT